MKTGKILLAVLASTYALAALADRIPPGTDEEIRERLEPFGAVCRAGDPCGEAAGGATAAVGEAMSGEQVYNQFCGTCHVTGVAGAPQLENAEAWAPRIAKGMETLWEHTLNGFNAMPPKGTCMDCSEEELRAALTYIVDQVE